MYNKEQLIADLIEAKEDLNDSFYKINKIYDKVSKCDDLKCIAINGTKMLNHLWIPDSYEIDYINNILDEALENLQQKIEN